MLYEKEGELARLSVQEWIAEEVFSYQWFVIVGVIIVAYIIWLKLVDRKRGPELLLLGSLVAVYRYHNRQCIGSISLYDTIGASCL